MHKLQNYWVNLLALLFCSVVSLAAQTNPESARHAAEQIVAEAARWQAQKTAEERRQAIALLQAALPLWRAAGDRHGASDRHGGGQQPAFAYYARGHARGG